MSPNVHLLIYFYHQSLTILHAQLLLPENVFINQGKYYKVYGRQDNKVFLF